MQEPNSAPTSPSTPPPLVPVAQPLQYMPQTTSPYAGRKTALMVFGVLMLIAGAFFALSTVAALLGMLVMQTQAGAIRYSPAMFVSTLVTNGMLTVGLIAAGIGSVRAKRWVRPVVVPLGVLGALSMAIGAIVVLASILSGSFSPPGNLAAGPVDPVFIYGVMTIVMLGFAIIPGVYAWFYASERTRDALDYYDPRLGWTDVVPLPVFAVSLCYAIGAIIVLPGVAMPAFPTFGVVLHGVPAMIGVLVTAGLMAFIAVQTYLLRPVGWTAAVALVVIGMASMLANVATGAAGAANRELLADMFADVAVATPAPIPMATTVPTTVPTLAVTLSGATTTTAFNGNAFQQSLTRQMEAQAESQSTMQAITAIVAGGAMLAYLLWIRRHFVSSVPRGANGSARGVD